MGKWETVEKKNGKVLLWLIPIVFTLVLASVPLSPLFFDSIWVKQFKLSHDGSNAQLDSRCQTPSLNFGISRWSLAHLSDSNAFPRRPRNLKCFKLWNRWKSAQNPLNFDNCQHVFHLGLRISCIQHLIGLIWTIDFFSLPVQLVLTR